jgi:hypothetical protein
MAISLLTFQHAAAASAEVRRSLRPILLNTNDFMALK